MSKKKRKARGASASSASAVPSSDTSSASVAQPICIERRSFAGLVIGVIASAITGVVGLTLGRYATAPALAKEGETGWSDAGLWQDIGEGMVVKRNIVVAQEAGWGRHEVQRLVWVVRQGDEVKVFSAACPHLGCTINESANGFVCPCHGSAWDMQGVKLRGPTPRGMDVIEHRIAEGRLQVRYQSPKQETQA